MLVDTLCLIILFMVYYFIAVPITKGITVQLVGKNYFLRYCVPYFLMWFIVTILYIYAKELIC